METKAMDKHIQKLKSMSTPGAIENYVKKHIVPLLIEFFRAQYGLEASVTEYIDSPYNFFDSMRGFFLTVEEMENMKKTIDEEIEARKHKAIRLD